MAISKKKQAQRDRAKHAVASQRKPNTKSSANLQSPNEAQAPASGKDVGGGTEKEGSSTTKPRPPHTDPPTANTNTNTNTATPTYSIPSPSKPMIAQRYPSSLKPEPKAGHSDSADSPTQPRLIFTHGAGGGISNAATSSFMTGFSSEGMVGVCFQGSMNLKNRVKCFEKVVEFEAAGVEGGDGEGGVGGVAGVALGGRSMGARAAVMACKEMGWERGALVLVSYPLVSPKGEVRDEILLEVEGGVDVLFVSGERDGMMDWERLERVRGDMKARSWVVVVKGADHGMGLTGKAKKGVERMREETGRLAAEWLERGRAEGKGWTKTLEWDEVQEKCILVSSDTDAQSGDDEKGGDLPEKAVKAGRGKRKSAGPETEPDRSAKPPAKRRKKAR